MTRETRRGRLAFAGRPARPGLEAVLLVVHPVARRYIPTMTKRLGAWMIGYGVFLAAMGVTGYLSNPGKAATALVSGGTFGALSIAWGVLLRRGMGWARWAALATTGLLTAVFAWRGTASWTAVQAGQPKLVAALVITAMGLASLATLYVLVTASSRARAAAHAPAA